MYSLLPALVSGLYLGYGLYVLSSRGANRISLSFMALCLATSGWQGIWAVLFQTSDPAVATVLVRAGYLVIIFLPTCLYHFVVEVLGARSERRWLASAYAVAAVLAVLNIGTDLFVAGHDRHFFGYYPRAGPVHWVHVLQAGLAVLRGAWLCLSTARTSSDLQRVRFRACGLGLLVYLMAAVDYLCNYGLTFYPPGIVFITVSLGILARAIARYGLLEPAQMAASVAHEMRTPLATIRLKTELLNAWLPTLNVGYRAAVDGGLVVAPEGRPDLDQLTAMVRDIARQIDRSNTVIDMILASMQTERIDASGFVTGSMCDCVQDALDSYPFHPTERPRVSWTCPSDFLFHGSCELMTFVLFNLLKNALFAIRARGSGDIALQVGTATGDRVLTVRDTGCGIRATDRARIFESFFSTKRLQGVGLGLPFCRKVMDAFGGTITFDSVEGEYTVFVLTFPAPGPVDQARIRPPDSPTS